MQTFIIFCFVVFCYIGLGVKISFIRDLETYGYWYGKTKEALG